MKLSICIPVYNFDMNPLVESLKNQIDKDNLDAEIILIDDASDLEFIEKNKTLESKVSQFIFLEKNIGRSKIRNLFLKYSQSEFLLFLDCDVKMIHQDFIKSYFSEIEKNPETNVFYGGFVVDENQKNLRNYYSRKREISTDFGSSDFDTFKTVNFVVKRSVFEKFPFNENLTQYGYEDYVFAKILEQNAVSYLFVNNPVLHLDDSDNVDYLQKTELGMESLYQLSQDSVYKDKIKDIKIYKVSQMLKRLKCQKIFLTFYKLFEKRILKNLLSESPDIYCFDLYKMGKFVEYQQNKKWAVQDSNL